MTFDTVSGVSVKVEFYGELRRFTSTNGSSFASLQEEVANTLNADRSKGLVIKYRDDEGDMITLSSDLELKSAISSGNVLRLFVSYKDGAPTQVLGQTQPQVPLVDVNMMEVSLEKGAIPQEGQPGGAPPAFPPGQQPPGMEVPTGFPQPFFGPQGGPAGFPCGGPWEHGRGGMGHFGDGGRGGMGHFGDGGRGGCGRGGMWGHGPHRGGGMWGHPHPHPHPHPWGGRGGYGWGGRGGWKHYQKYAANGEAPGWVQNQDALVAQVEELGFDVRKEKIIKMLWKYNGNMEMVASKLAAKKEKMEYKKEKMEYKMAKKEEKNLRKEEKNLRKEEKRLRKEYN